MLIIFSLFWIVNCHENKKYEKTIAHRFKKTVQDPGNQCGCEKKNTLKIGIYFELKMVTNHKMTLSSFSFIFYFVLLLFKHYVNLEKYVDRFLNVPLIWIENRSLCVYQYRESLLIAWETMTALWYKIQECQQNPHFV